MKVSVLGLGEAGARYASDLSAAGHQMTGFDPGPAPTPAGVKRAASAAEAVADAELIIALTPSKFSVGLVREAASSAPRGTVWADLSSASPATMQEAGAVASEAGLRFADGAVLGTVPAKGARTALVISGEGAPAAVDFFTEIGAKAELVEGEPGQATAMKLVRSVALKGFAVVCVEAMNAAKAAGIEAWMRGQIAAQLAGGEDMLDRFLTGTVTHAERRAHEMSDASDYLESLGAESDMSRATVAAMQRIQAAKTA